MKKKFYLFLTMLLLCTPSSATTLSIPFPNFVPGATIFSSQVNSNNAAISSWANGGVDNSNIGPAGIFASQILPTTTAQATFGGTLPYTFNAAISAPSINIPAITATTGTFSGAVSAAGGLSAGATGITTTGPVVATGNGSFATVTASGNVLSSAALSSAFTAVSGEVVFGTGGGAGVLAYNTDAYQFNNDDGTAAGLTLANSGALTTGSSTYRANGLTTGTGSFSGVVGAAGIASTAGISGTSLNLSSGLSGTTGTFSGGLSAASCSCGSYTGTTGSFSGVVASPTIGTYYLDGGQLVSSPHTELFPAITISASGTHVATFGAPFSSSTSYACSFGAAGPASSAGAFFYISSRSTTSVTITNGASGGPLTGDVICVGQ